MTTTCRAVTGERRIISWSGAHDAVADQMIYVGRDVTADYDACAAAEERSRTDALTGVYPRRHLIAAVVAELGRARREGHSPGSLMLDFDTRRAPRP